MDKIKARKTAKPTRREFNCSPNSIGARCYFDVRCVPTEAPTGAKLTHGSVDSCRCPWMSNNRAHTSEVS